MYRYVGDLSNLAHNIIKNYCSEFAIAVDATLGNGYDTDFLSTIFNQVFCFEIQKSAAESYGARKKENVTIINDSHENILTYIDVEVDCVIYNLGYLPGGDKNITTKADATIESLKQALKILRPGGIISISIYIGHKEGEKERDKIMQFVNELPKNEFGAMLHTFINRNNKAPMLLIIEKNQKI
ncbi:tRNA (mnm(5)s(2)U34)-methyltransferase [Candidatus Clostridium radicumherbarum]|uniref:tRNA (Mnm(5)s(2)U34)-methyltransferase n=1 Tax=Candidatus Clostridium radicumherbarum TaxID=3381662 RepID=A0ABW8TRG9_9CLOT